ncbi:retrovirus-related pol polyprotein from transposon TNT 1-94 [Tanacetum coccineum]
MASEHSSSRPALHEMTPATISSRLVPNPPPSTPFIPPSRSDWDILFQLLFDKLLTPPIAEVVAPVPTVSTGLPSSTNVDQDAPSHKDNHDIEVAHMGNDLYFGFPIPEDHPLENIIGELARPVSTRLQLHKQALFYYYDAFLTAVEPKTYKDALTQSCWIEAILEAIWIFLTFSAHMNMVVYQMDVKTAFLNALYGLKQAPCAWYDMLSSFLISQDFSKGSVDPTPFIRKEGKELLLVQVYVDDIIFVASTPELCDLFAKIIGIFINQSKYALESLKKYGFDSCDPVDTPMVEKSKLDKDKKGKQLIRHTNARPTEKQLHAVKRIFRYLRGTVNRGLWYPNDSSIELIAFVDADHAGCQDPRHSTSGSMQFLGDRLVSWSSKRQKSAAISNTEAEYIAMSGCCAQILWMRSQLTDYGLGFNKIPMYWDNKSAIALSCNNVQHSRSKHIDIRFHFIKEHVENGVIELYFVNTEYQLADIFTKALARERIEFLINKLGMRSFTPETLKQLADEVDE